MKPVVIVAGVGPGIGASIARAFGAEGFQIALLARNSARLAKRHAEIAAAGIPAAPFIGERRKALRSTLQMPHPIVRNRRFASSRMSLDQ
jgi:NAD(P)-dependent dehydrogenase (short-subunit alcohol dehydrogenase family)